MKTLVPSDTLAYDPVALEGLITSNDLAGILGCTSRTITQYVEQKKLPAIARDCGSTLHVFPYLNQDLPLLRTYPCESCRSDAVILSCLQVYYFLKKIGYPITKNTEDNAVRFLYYYSWEQDRTVSPVYLNNESLQSAFLTSDAVSHLTKRRSSLFAGFATYSDQLKAYLSLGTPSPYTFNEEQRMNFQAQQGQLAVKPVPVTSAGLLGMPDIAACLQCSRMNVSGICTSGQLNAFRLPGRGKAMFVTALHFLYYLRRRKYIPHPTILEAARNSVMTYGWSRDHTNDDLLTHAELNLPPKSYPYPDWTALRGVSGIHQPIC